MKTYYLNAHYIESDDKYVGQIYYINDDNNKIVVDNNVTIFGKQFTVNSRKIVEHKLNFKQCPICGKFFGTFDKRYKFCSDECSKINRNKTWVSRTDRYTENINLNNKNYATMITNVRKRANGHSELTGKKSDKLIAHHLNGYHWYVSGRCDPSNIIMLTETEHKHFHQIYGNKNNTIEQFMEFMELYP